MELLLIKEIIDAIKEAGHDPKSQLIGYITTGNENYITRTKNARDKIKLLDKAFIEKYIEDNFER